MLYITTVLSYFFEWIEVQAAHMPLTQLNHSCQTRLQPVLTFYVPCDVPTETLRLNATKRLPIYRLTALNASYYY